MEFGAVFEIMLAVFAVFGMVCLLKFTADGMFRPDNVVIAAKIFDRDAADEIDVLIEIIEEDSRGGEYCLLITKEMLCDEELMFFIERLGVKYYIVEK